MTTHPKGPFWLDHDQVWFPPPELATDDGLLAVGGDLSPRRLVVAYAHGIFPWYSEGSPILWWSPDPRFVLYPPELHVGRSLSQRVRNGGWEVTLDQAFDDVVAHCAETPRPEQDGTWITDAMATAYGDLHRVGLAHSVEAWYEGELVGGVYGVGLGRAFFGESMFARRSDASKVAFAWLVRQLEAWGFTIIDCQVETDHLSRFGARFVPRELFLQQVGRALDVGRVDTLQGPWSFDIDVATAGRRSN